MMPVPVKMIGATQSLWSIDRRVCRDGLYVRAIDRPSMHETYEGRLTFPRDACFSGRHRSLC
jgi:hypothetical protein